MSLRGFIFHCQKREVLQAKTLVSRRCSVLLNTVWLAPLIRFFFRIQPSGPPLIAAVAQW